MSKRLVTGRGTAATLTNATARRSTATLVLLLSAALGAAVARADPWAGAAGGAVAGGALGAVVSGGGTGAAVGAVVGTLMGAGAGSERQQQAQRDLQRMRAAEAQEWERERRRRAQQLRDAQQDPWGVDEAVTAPGAVGQGSRQTAPTVQVELVVEVQRSIQRLGYDPGTIGTLNRQTVALIKMYQAQHALLETGVPSTQLLEHMRRNGG